MHPLYTCSCIVSGHPDNYILLCLPMCAAVPRASSSCCAPHLFLLLLHLTPPPPVVPAQESMCVGPPSCMRDRGREYSARTPIRERGREHNAHSHVLTRLHALLWGTEPGGGGVPDSASVGSWPALALCMHFDQRVLSRLGTNNPLRARPTVGAGLHDRDRQFWMGACSACLFESQSAWGATPTVTY
jgi:hypothetical protein